MSTNGNGSAPGDEVSSSHVRDKDAKSEQELIAKAIHDVAYPDRDWEEVGERKDLFMRMAAASVSAAMDPIEPRPPYPADLLDLLAEQLAYKYLNPGHFHERARDAWDQYTQEVGRENVPDIVAKAIAEL